MPTYCYKCPNCGEKAERTFSSWQYEIVPVCSECGLGVMVRDFSSEKATSNFHPSIDVYANSLKQRKRRR
jgi:DNA-directed RNA polymerase subunit RPC12/RpoP